jgi:hypothetical protein
MLLGLKPSPRVTPGGAVPENVFTEGEKFSGADQAAGPEGV